MEYEVLISSGDGDIPAFVVTHDERQARPAVIFFMDAFGLRPELEAMARRVARLGYVCILPDLYHRLGRLRFGTQHASLGTPVVLAAVAHLSHAMVLRDVAAVLAFLDAQTFVAQAPLGTIGHCMGGRFATAAIGAFPTRIKAMASLYGVGLVTERHDSPHLAFGAVDGDMYFAFGAADEFVTLHDRNRLEAELATAGIAHITDVFDGADHGFCFPSRPSYHPTAAEASWERVAGLLRRKLTNHGTQNEHTKLTA